MSGLSLLAALKAFDATIRRGSMSAAARELGLQQPTVSAHIASLERQYGVELFHRQGRTAVPTAFGDVLREFSQRIFRAEEEAHELLLAAKSRYQGRLVVLAVGPYNVVPLVKRYRETWPKVSLAVSVGDSRRIVQRILSYDGDIGLVLHGVQDPRVHCVPYKKQALVIFAHRDHPLASLDGVTLADLQGMEFVMREEGSTTRQVFEDGLREAQVTIRTAVEMGSRESVREAVAQGLGLGVVADTAYVPDPRLRRLPIKGIGLHTHAHLICLAERRNSPLIAAFLELASKDLPRGCPN
jgi:aminoethylphosphonate catabolism LysR family transcriptional regulator